MESKQAYLFTNIEKEKKKVKNLVIHFRDQKRDEQPAIQRSNYPSRLISTLSSGTKRESVGSVGDQLKPTAFSTMRDFLSS